MMVKLRFAKWCNDGPWVSLAGTAWSTSQVYEQLDVNEAIKQGQSSLFANLLSALTPSR